MPDPTDPPVILRNRLAAGLEAMGIFDIDSIARVIMDGTAIMVVRYIHSETGGVMADPYTNVPATETTRIEIR